MDDERKVGGKSFQTRGPATAKLRDPHVIVLVLGTIRSPRAAERRQRRPVTEHTFITLHYIKSYLECPKSLRTARTLYEIKGVMWEYSYVGKHLEKR